MNATTIYTQNLIGLSGTSIGFTGPTGSSGIPIGGTLNQLLAKQSSTDYDTIWTSDITANTIINGEYTGTNMYLTENLAIDGRMAITSTTIAIGLDAGNLSPGGENVAIGSGAGNLEQGARSIAIGKQAGNDKQGISCIAIGQDAGYTEQGSNSIAIGYQAGNGAQGINSIAIGNSAGNSSQHANTIIINASGAALNSSGIDRMFVAPIRNTGGTSIPAFALYYNPTTKEICYG